MSLSGCRSESVMMRGMVIDMEGARLQTIAQVRAFLDGATEIAFRVPEKERNGIRSSSGCSRDLAIPHRGASARECCSGIWRASRGSHASR